MRSAYSGQWKCRLDGMACEMTSAQRKEIVPEWLSAHPETLCADAVRVPVNRWTEMT
jgi:hypothetical protein